MRIIHCTQKLLKELKIAKPAPAPDILPAKGLGNWYANLLRINRRKCILFTNQMTMYSFLVPNVVQADLKAFSSLFVANLLLNLQYHGFTQDTISGISREYEQIAYAKTKDRSILGSMNDMAFHCRVYVEREGHLDGNITLFLNQKINEIPMKAMKFQSPIEALEKQLGYPARRHKMIDGNNPDDWLMEIAAAYCDAYRTIPYGKYVDTEITENDLFQLAAPVCIKFRGIPNTKEVEDKVLEAALSSYVVTSEHISELKTDPHLAFAFCYLASHYGLGLLEEEVINRLMEYVEANADRFGRIIEYKCK